MGGIDPPNRENRSLPPPRTRTTRPIQGVYINVIGAISSGPRTQDSSWGSHSVSIVCHQERNGKEVGINTHFQQDKWHLFRTGSIESTRSKVPLHIHSSSASMSQDRIHSGLPAAAKGRLYWEDEDEREGEGRKKERCVTCK